MPKHTKETAKEEKDVAYMKNPLTAACRCGKFIKLDRPYDFDHFRRHRKGMGCKLNENVQSVTTFYKPVEAVPGIVDVKQKFCEGLCSEKHRKYIDRSGAFDTYGGAPPEHILLRDLFPHKFSDKKTTKKTLKPEELNRLRDEQRARALWYIDLKSYCVRSTNCMKFAEDGICNACNQLQSKKSFQVIIIYNYNYTLYYEK
jgi:hypothetical protein